ncbi:MAG: PmoA family protein [Pirellulales bacterium]|nr:PmoA family protein [Pirellulales bacterium]
MIATTGIRQPKRQCLLFLLSLVACCLLAVPASAAKVSIRSHEDRLEVYSGEELRAAYIFRGHSRPLIYPVVGPYGLKMTRAFPIIPDVPGEPRDHVHQKSMFFAHGKVNGVNFFKDGSDAGTTVHKQPPSYKCYADRAVIEGVVDWRGPDGKIVCTDKRRLTFRMVPDGQIIDWQVTLCASHGELNFGDDKHGLMAIRMHPSLQLHKHPTQKKSTANGQVINSEGVKGEGVFGKRARWIDYWGKIDGKEVGIAVFDHPANPRHPVWWMARGYGYLGADPFGAHCIGGEPPGTGDMRIPDGKSITFRYRYVFHAGDPKEAGIERLYQSYVKESEE